MALNKPGLITAMQCRLAQSRVGRTLLHLGCIVRGGRVVTHLRGITRALQNPSTKTATVRRKKKRKK